MIAVCESEAYTINGVIYRKDRAICDPVFKYDSI